MRFWLESCLRFCRVWMKSAVVAKKLYQFQDYLLKAIILNNFKILQNNPETGAIFSLPPLISFKRDKNVPTNSVAPSSVYKAYTTHNSSICSDEGLTLETSVFQSLYGGQFTLSTPLINQIFVFHSPTDAAPQFLQETNPFYPVWHVWLPVSGAQYGMFDYQYLVPSMACLITRIWRPVWHVYRCCLKIRFTRQLFG